MGGRSAGPLTALVAGAISLRPELIAIGPLLPRIQDSLGVSHSAAGLVVTVPVIAMGVFAPAASLAAVRVGPRKAIAWSLAAIAAFGFLRLLSPQVGVLLLLTLPIGVAMAVANGLFPLAVREWFGDRPLGATAGYTTGIQIGAALSGLTAVPLAVALGGWRMSLAVLTLMAVLSFAAWVRFAPAAGRIVSDDVRLGRPPLGSSLAWRLAVGLGLLGMCFWGVSAWITDAFLEIGWSEACAAALTAVINVGAVLGNLSVFALGGRVGSRRAHMVLAAVLFFAGACLLALVPSGAFAWALLFGYGNGLLFPALLTVPLDVSRDARDTASMTAMILGVGYVLAGCAPFVLGVARDASGSFSSVLWISIALSGALLLLVASLGAGQLRLPSREEGHVDESAARLAEGRSAG